VNIFHLINVITAHKPSPLAKQVKRETKSQHDRIESHPLISKLIKGNITDLEYAVYLKNLLPIYRAVEQMFFDINTAGDLIRSRLLEQDIENYSKVIDLTEEKYNNLSKDWVNLFYSKSLFLKKTELYIRWLADMYGGQMIKNNVKFNAKYKFNNVRQSIKDVRTLLEKDLTEENVVDFIAQVNVSYDMHHTLANKVYAATN
jgi:heme oxygenase